MQGIRQFQAKEGAPRLQARTEGALNFRLRWRQLGGSTPKCRKFYGSRLRQEFGDSRLGWKELADSKLGRIELGGSKLGWMKVGNSKL